jgi:hypothetical protein
MVDDGKPEAGEELGAFARLLHRERRTRDAYMSEGLFGEPAWDILLDLFACQAEGRWCRSAAPASPPRCLQARRFAISPKWSGGG